MWFWASKNTKYKTERESPEPMRGALLYDVGAFTKADMDAIPVLLLQ